MLRPPVRYQGEFNDNDEARGVWVIEPWEIPLADGLSLEMAGTSLRQLGDSSRHTGGQDSADRYLIAADQLQKPFGVFALQLHRRRTTEHDGDLRAVMVNMGNLRNVDYESAQFDQIQCLLHVSPKLRAGCWRREGDSNPRYGF